MARYEFKVVVDVEPDAVDGDVGEAVADVFDDVLDYISEAVDGVGKVVTGSFTRLADHVDEHPAGKPAMPIDDVCSECGGDLDDGEGWDGRCGPCADRVEASREDES